MDNIPLNCLAVQPTTTHWSTFHLRRAETQPKHTLLCVFDLPTNSIVSCLIYRNSPQKRSWIGDAWARSKITEHIPFALLDPIKNVRTNIYAFSLALSSKRHCRNKVRSEVTNWSRPKNRRSCQSDDCQNEVLVPVPSICIAPRAPSAEPHALAIGPETMSRYPTTWPEIVKVFTSMQNTDLSLVMAVTNAKDLALALPPGVEACVTGADWRICDVLGRLFGNDLLHGRSRRRHCTSTDRCCSCVSNKRTHCMGSIIWHVLVHWIKLYKRAGVTLPITGIVLLVDVDLVFICTSIRSCGITTMVSTICSWIHSTINWTLRNFCEQ